MPRLIFVNRFFFPDHSATSQILSDLAFHLVEAGRTVHVITSQQRYDDGRAVLPERETIRGVEVHRIATTRFGRKNLFGRAVDYLSFYASARTALLQTATSGDIIIAKTDPPLLSIVAMHAARRRRAHLVNWLQDLYPEVAENLGVPYVGGPVAYMLRMLRDRSVRFAAMNVTVGGRMAAKVSASAGSDIAVCVIQNWTDEEQVLPVQASENPLRASWELENKFVVGYSGNLGRAHEFETILGAADLLRDNSRITFLFIGGGHSFDQLARRVNELKLERMFCFMPYQDRAQLRYSLGVPDVHLLTLRPEVEGLIVPSKFYGIAAAGRPVLAVIARDGEFAPLIENWHSGLVIEPGQPGQLADAISRLAQDKMLRLEMGRQARRMLEAEFTRRRAFQRWRDVFACIAN
ncbi:MAG TPA: glycosyltransferase family 4 protein [Rhizomicrobium sp.]|nr:glycosyltransferase family 4 protein [Rhizomicrobium sp.]